MGASREIITIARAERSDKILRCKQQATLERHEVPLESIEKILVRLTPHPEKQLLADLLIKDGPVLRLSQERTIIDYRSLFDDVAFNGLENFRRFVAVASSWLPEERRDAATIEFSQGQRPEAFTDAREMGEYDAFLRGSRQDLPAGHQKEATPPPDEIVAQHLAELRAQEAAMTPATTGSGARLAGLAVCVLGLLLAGLGMAGLFRVLTTDSGAPSGPMMGAIAIGVSAGMLMAMAGLWMIRRADQFRERHLS